MTNGFRELAANSGQSCPCGTAPWWHPPCLWHPFLQCSHPITLSLVSTNSNQSWWLSGFTKLSHTSGSSHVHQPPGLSLPQIPLTSTPLSCIEEPQDLNDVKQDTDSELPASQQPHTTQETDSQPEIQSQVQPPTGAVIQIADSPTTQINLVTESTTHKITMPHQQSHIEMPTFDDLLTSCDKHAVTVDWMPLACIDKLPPGHGQAAVWAFVSGLLLKTDVFCVEHLTRVFRYTVIICFYIMISLKFVYRHTSTPAENPQTTVTSESHFTSGGLHTTWRLPTQRRAIVYSAHLCNFNTLQSPLHSPLASPDTSFTIVVSPVQPLSDYCLSYFSCLLLRSYCWTRGLDCYDLHWACRLEFYETLRGKLLCCGSRLVCASDFACRCESADRRAVCKWIDPSQYIRDCRQNRSEFV